MSKPEIEELEINVSQICEPELFSMRNVKESDVAELAENIKAVGRILNPLFVRPDPELPGTYELICGHRRLKAARKLKLDKVPCRVQALSDEDAFSCAISENIGRSDPSPIEEARAYKRARDQFKMNLKEIAKKVGKDESTISNRIRLLDMVPAAVQALQDGDITAGHCEHGFLKLKHEQDQKELLQHLKQQKNWRQPATVAEAERRAREIAATRERVEALGTYFQQKKKEIKFPKCPKCGGVPDTDSHRWREMDLKKDLLRCAGYSCEPWNAITGPLPKPKPVSTGREGVILQKKDEALGHLSQYSPTQFFKTVSGHLIDNELVEHLTIEDAYPSVLRISITLHDSKALEELPLPMASFEGIEREKSGHRSSVRLHWQSDNKEILKQRSILWDLESAMGKKPKAEIVRVAMLRLVLEHKALSKGLMLEVEGGKLEGPWIIKDIHRDFTAWVTNPKGEKVFLEEDDLRALVKAAFPKAKKEK